MRIVIKVYHHGDMYAVETPNDGTSEKVLLGRRGQTGERISTFVEVMADENETGAQRVLQALDWLKDEMHKRKQAYARKKATKKKRASAKASR
jgi:hypothetical protein